MGRCLLVANQTLGGDELDRAVRDRIERGVDRFYVLVPMTRVMDESTSWGRGFPLMEETQASSEHLRIAMEEDSMRHEEALEQARERAQLRLDQMIQMVRSAGGDAEGELGTDDPLEATRVVLQRETFDEVIVSTLPGGLSRWLKMDLPNRVARLTDVPVATVEAEE